MGLRGAHDTRGAQGDHARSPRLVIATQKVWYLDNSKFSELSDGLGLEAGLGNFRDDFFKRKKVLLFQAGKYSNI